jgi:hypothetical protein
MLSPPKQDSSRNMHIEEAPVNAPQLVDEIEEAKDLTLNKVCFLCWSRST